MADSGRKRAVIVYQTSKRQFVHDTFQDDTEAVLAQQFLRSTGHQPSPSDLNVWKHSSSLGEINGIAIRGGVVVCGGVCRAASSEGRCRQIAAARAKDFGQCGLSGCNLALVHSGIGLLNAG
jgi:hypothetical protein